MLTVNHKPSRGSAIDDKQKTRGNFLVKLENVAAVEKELTAVSTNAGNTSYVTSCATPRVAYERLCESCVHLFMNPARSGHAKTQALLNDTGAATASKVLWLFNHNETSCPKVCAAHISTSKKKIAASSPSAVKKIPTLHRNLNSNSPRLASSTCIHFRNAKIPRFRMESF